MRVVIELCWIDAETIEGELQAEGGETTAFRGWLELLGLLERLRRFPGTSP